MNYYVNRLKGILYSKIGANLKLRMFVQKLASELIKSRSLKGNNLYFQLQETEHYQEELKIKGITYLGKILTNDVIDNITESIKSLECHDTWKPELGNFKLNDVTEETHTASFKREDLIKEKIIFDVANNEGVLRIVEDYLGATPTISNVNAWWSFGGRKKAQEAQNFHRDNDDIKFCKLFIYLTDITEKSGPHIYVENTVNSDKLREIKRYKDEEVIEAFGESAVKTLVYPKGHAFIEDTYGIHKGLLPVSENRLLLQIQYSISPIGYIKYVPERLDYGKNYSSYINRLLIK